MYLEVRLIAVMADVEISVRMVQFEDDVGDVPVPVPRSFRETFIVSESVNACQIHIDAPSIVKLVLPSPDQYEHAGD